MLNLTDLTTRATAAQGPLAAQVRYTHAAYLDANAQMNRLALAQVLLDAQVPAGSFVHVTDWADETNEDGTFDLDVAEVVDADDEPVEEIGDLGGQGAVPAGRAGGGTDWDIFFDDPAADEPRIVVDKVYAWLAALPTDAADA